MRAKQRQQLRGLVFEFFRGSILIQLAIAVFAIVLIVATPTAASILFEFPLFGIFAVPVFRVSIAIFIQLTKPDAIEFSEPIATIEF